MTCRYARRHMGDLFDSENVPTANPELRRHLEECAGCARDFVCLERALAVPQLVREMQASPDFKERTMNKLTTQLQTPAPARHWMPAMGLRLAFGAAVILALVIGLPFVGSIGGHSNSGAVALLAQSVQAMSNLTSVHMTARMRTLPGDNFELIGLQYDFVPVELWKQFGETPRWRVEKPERVVVMDGTSSLMLRKPSHAARGGKDTGFVEWLKPLMDADKVLQSELTAAEKKESQAVLTHDGAQRTLMTVTRKAQGDLTNDWVRNKSINEADHTRIYSFDSATNRLTGLQVFVHDNGKDALVFEVTDVRYNETFDPKLFTIELPENVVWWIAPDQMPVTSQPLPKTPRDAAVAFFESMAQQKWEQVLTLVPQSSLSDGFKKTYGGLQVISIGEPFQSGLYPGWFVPYEIRMANGQVRKHKLAMKYSKKAQRFYMDGGY